MTPRRRSSRIDPEVYQSLDLRAHELLADVPLHDAWRFQLEGGGPEITMQQVIERFVDIETSGVNKPARALFVIRQILGRWFRWDRDDPTANDRSYIHRLTNEDREKTLDVPGAAQGFWKCVYRFEREAVGEVINRTVHAFLVFALEPVTGGHELYWGIHVKPVNRFTRVYMALIDPFRRLLIYPVLIRRFEASWRMKSAGDVPRKGETT